MARDLITIKANGDTSLGDCSPSTVGTHTLHIQGLAGGNITPKHRALGSGLTAVACRYIKDSDGSTVAAGTAITVDGIYYVPTDAGLELVLTTAAWASNISVADTPQAG